MTSISHSPVFSGLKPECCMQISYIANVPYEIFVGHFFIDKNLFMNLGFTLMSIGILHNKKIDSILIILVFLTPISYYFEIKPILWVIQSIIRLTRSFIRL